MKVLFYSVNNMWVPHFETELELLLNHKQQGDELFVLTCAGALPTCVSNYDHLRTACMKCRLRFDGGMKIVGIDPRNIFYLKNYALPVTVPAVFNSWEQLMQWSWEGIDFGRMIASSLITHLRDHVIDVQQHQQKIRDKLTSAFRAFFSTDEVIKCIKPDRVYIYNGRFCEVAAAVAACKHNGVEFTVHERGGTVDSYALFKNTTPHDIAYGKAVMKQLWEAADPTTSHPLAEQWFKDRRAGLEQSWLSFTAYQKKGLVPQLFNHKTNIAIFNSSIDEYAAFPEWQNPLYADELQALQAIFDAYKNDKSVHFYLRIHPHLKGFDNGQMKALRALAQQGYSNVTFIWPAEVIDSYALLEKCDKAVVFGSTIGAEACFWGTPTVLIGRSFYEDLDCCYIPTSREHAIRLIEANLLPKDPAHALPYGYWEMNRGIPFRYFKPQGLFKGAFLGKELKPQYSLKNKLLFKLYDRLDRYTLKRAKRRLVWRGDGVQEKVG